ncbi:MAG: tetratricopeptide repeat protein [Bacteroidia bacterium]|nr:tetratricopeptide repeat protein [Bacteroidia bacterium]
MTLIKFKIIILVFFTIMGFINLSNCHVLPDSLNKTIGQKSDKEKIEYLNKLAEKNSKISPEKSIELAKLSLEISKKTKDRKGELNALLIIGKAYKNLGKYAEGLEYFSKSLEIYSAANLKEGKAYCHNEIGTLNKNLGKTSNALSDYQNALQIYQELKDNKNSYSVLGNIGTLYYKTQEHQKAIEYYKKAYSLIETSGNYYEIAITLNQIGAAYANWGNNGEALTYLEKAKKTAEQNNLNQLLSSITKNIEDVRTNISNQDKQKTSFEKDENIKKEQYVAALETENILTKNANLKSLEEIEKLSFENQAKELKLHIIQDRYDRQVLVNKMKEQSIQLLNTKHKLTKAELAKEQEILKTQKTIIAIILSALGIVTLLLIFLYRLYSFKKKANILLNQKNIEIQQQKEEIQAQAEELLNINKELEKLSIVAKETINAVLIADSNGIIEWLNPGAVKMFGEGINTIIGKRYADTSRHPAPVQFLDKCFKEKTSVYYESYGDYPVGRIYTHTTLTPVLDSNGTVTKVVIIDTDITEIREAKDLLEKQNTQILDSINFAKLIQEAILPSEEMLKKAFPESFLFFQPRDIVSGDFYWLHTEGYKTLIALADCTGHGVPGAFMSMIGNTLLNQIIKQQKIFSPAAILDNLNVEINYLLNQGGQNYDAGMDITICCIDYETNQILVGLAGHTLYCFQQGEIIEKECDYVSVGDILSTKIKDKFCNLSIDIQNDLIIYMTSDGYTDQFGGNENRKFNSIRFKQMLSDIASLNMEKQKEIISDTFSKWKGGEKQIDDVTVMGIRLK